MHDSRKVYLFLILCLFFGFLICAGCTQKEGASPLVTEGQTPGMPVSPGQPDPGAPAGTCQEPQTWCNGRCADLSAERENCGACGALCPTGQICRNTQCVSGDMENPGATACEPGLALCSGRCMDIANDPGNCGSCGMVCPTGQSCSGGTCSSGVPGITATPGITSTSTTSGTPSCTSGQTNCYGSCVDLQSDTGHCGTCNTKCASGKVCSAGSCTISCSAGQNNCGGSCINTQTSSQHCGKCNNPCSSGQTCQNGKCGLYAVVVTLDPQQVMCASSGKLWCSGTCISQDVSNCGTCGHACTSGQSCQNGKCGLYAGVMTLNPQAICTGSGKLWCSGACVDQKSDSSNCGSCGHACKSGEACSQGTCLSWTGSWYDPFVFHPIKLVQTGSSVTGSYTEGPFIYTYTGTTSGNPPVFTGTWIDNLGFTGKFQFTMSADGKQFLGWTSADGTPGKISITGTRT